MIWNYKATATRRLLLLIDVDIIFLQNNYERMVVLFVEHAGRQNRSWLAFAQHARCDDVVAR